MEKVRIVLTSVGLYEKAEEMARTLVERRLAACVNIIGPVRSVYRWKGTIENEQEYVLLIKTTADRSAALAAALVEVHPYELPERVELDVTGGSAAYLSWIIDQVAHEGQ